jgi:hypothetical protein
MQQGAQLCSNGNFPVDRSEHPSLASRYSRVRGWGPCPDAAARMLKMEHRATFHPRGLGRIPSTEAHPPQAPRKLSRTSQSLTIYTNPPITTIPARLCSPTYASNHSGWLWDRESGRDLLRAAGWSLDRPMKTGRPVA